ncbi:MAG: tetratricopeptide repeat protein, partial [Planctomycetia bacterium]
PEHARKLLKVLAQNGMLRSANEPNTSQMLAANFQNMHLYGLAGAYHASGRLSNSGGVIAPAELNMRSLAAVNDRPNMEMGGGMGRFGGKNEAKAEDLVRIAQTSPAGRPSSGELTCAPCEPTPCAERPSDSKPERSFGLATPTFDNGRARRDVEMLAMVQQQEANQAAQVALMRENQSRWVARSQQGQQSINNNAYQIQLNVCQVFETLSAAELARQEKAIEAAYKIFQEIVKEYSETATATLARTEILATVTYWRSIGQPKRAAALAKQFLKDNPTDRDLPSLRLQIARDWLTWAAMPVVEITSKQEKLSEVCKRFDNARKELAKIVTEFPKQQTYLQKAQWEIASSFLTQARVVNSFSSTLARGQYVRASKELAKVAEKYSDHPNLGQIPQMLWTISQELESRAYYDEAILVWNELTMYNPMDSYAKQAALKIAQTYHHKLKRPLRAAEAYQELNFARGGNDQSLQNSIFQIGSDLKNEKRWVESLHVLESFVDSFPKHAQAGQALKMVGQIHQTNEAWEDAIKAYQRVIAEFHNGQWSQEAKWAIAECKINLSKWHEAKEDYLSYVETYHDSKMNEAKRRIELLKDLERYQGLVDEKGQRKAFDAQYQIAEIVKDRLQNKVKAIIEYRKVTSKWPKSHLADDALYAIGNTYLALGETTKAREALLKVGEKYPASPLADDALYLVGKSYEEEATKLASVTRESTLERAKEVAQKKAYTMSQSNRRSLMKSNYANVKKLKAAGKGMQAEQAEASNAFSYGQFNSAQAILFAQKAEQEVESLSAAQMADRQDKVNAALRKAVESFTSASKIAGADKADEALLQMATIYDTRLKDSKAAMETWLEIVRQFSGTTVAEDASWRIAEYYQREGKYAEAIEAYKAFLRNYRRSPKAGNAQFAVAENCEKLNQWVQAMDAYTNYITNFPSGPLVNKAKEQINWIKTYRL